MDKEVYTFIYSFKSCTVQNGWSMTSCLLNIKLFFRKFPPPNPSLPALQWSIKEYITN